MDLTSIPAATEIVRAADVEIVVARLGTELAELESRLAAATQVAESSEARARSAGADLGLSAWMLVRFRRYLDELVAEAETADRELVDLARRQALRFPAARVLPGPRPDLQLPTPAFVLDLPPVDGSNTAPAVRDPRLHTEVAAPSPVRPDEEAWSSLAGPAGRDPNEPFWPRGVEREADPERSRRAFSVSALLRVGSAVCVAGACILRFG